MVLMLRVALRPRFLGLLALMVVATLVCGLLAGWQWDRAHRVLSDQAAGSQDLGDIRDVLGVGGAITNEIVGDTVSARGSYLPGEQIVVPGRFIDDTDAAIVVSSLLVDMEDGTQARLPVARGWLPVSEITAANGEIDPTLAPAPPQGEVEISGRLEASESASGGVEGGVAQDIATPQLVNEWGSPMFAGFVAPLEPAGALRPLPAAESEFSRGLNWQNIGYSLQWVMFGGFFLFLWWRSVRAAHLDEVADRREAMQRILDQSGLPPAGQDSSLSGRSAAESTPPASPSEARSDSELASTSVVAATTVPTPDKDV